MRALTFAVCALSVISLASCYCNMKTYKAYLKKQEVTCGSSKSTYCDKECEKSITQWIMYSDGCVAPNENSLPHPFLDDNGINPVYQKDAHEMKVRYRHYCNKPWSAGSTLAPSAMLTALASILVAGIAVMR